MQYPIYKPKIFPNTKKYVEDCLETTWISSKGSYIKKFENSFADYLNINYATSVSNGTTALHMCLCSLGIGEGDEVIVPSFTYIASVNAIKYVGAEPVFIDSDKSTWNLDVNLIAGLITNKTKAIMAVHLYGNPCDMSSLRKLCDEKKLLLIEDVAEALGSTYEDKFLGTFGDVASFSFFGNKTITTGEGGMVVSNNKEIIDKVASLKNQGASGKKYWYEEVGYNYRMTNICAAIGLSQVEQIEPILIRKKAIANLYQELLSSCPLDFQIIQSKGDSSCWLVSILTDNKKTRDGLSKFLNQSGIETRPFFYPAHTMPMFKQDSNFLIAEDLSSRGLNLPSFPDLSNQDVIKIAECIKTFFRS
jgi:perosamine synthetase